MRIAMLATASAMAFIFAIGSVSAADQFKTLRGVKAIQMTAGELSAVKGMDHHFTVTNPRTGEVTEHNTDQHQDSLSCTSTNPATCPVIIPANFKMIEFPTITRLAAPGYMGLRKACGNGVIDGPGFLC
jgi:hypothetical protein